MDNFYVMLPSNVKSFPQNTIANYKTKLASRLIFNDDWEVGLVEISYTLSWYNVPKQEPIYLMYWDEKIKRYFEKIHLPPGRYNTITEVISVINYRLNRITWPDDFKFQTEKLAEKEVEKKPSIEVRERDRITTIKQGVLKNNKLVFLELSENLCNIFGINHKYMKSKYEQQFLNYKEIEAEYKKQNQSMDGIIYAEPEDDLLTHKSEKPYELSGGYHSLFVYSDIVSPSFVGDSYTQLLRLVEIPSDYKFGDQVKITYPSTYYIPVLVKEFDTIEIDIKDDTGENIPFEFGRSILTLHFRKVYKRNDNFII
jgi:hypothetical protein